jgi:hypothetical protein
MGSQGTGLTDPKRLVDERLILAEEQGTIHGVADQARHAGAALDRIPESRQGTFSAIRH